MGRGKKKNRSVVPSASSSSSSVHLSESKPKPPSSPMACLICYSYAEVSSESMEVQFYGFILDPAAEAAHNDGDGDGEGFMPLNPRFRLDGLSLAAFCIVNSILYVFESRDGTDDYRKSVYSLDLSSLLNESSSEMVVIEKGMLEKCAEMEGDKFCAVAILTPKGKILVFSVRTGSGYGCGYAANVDFELFDPDTKQCRPLPQLPKTSNLSKMFRIYGYGFLSDALFMVSTNNGKYAFDFDRNNGWENFRSTYEPLGLFVGFGNELYTTNGLIRKGDTTNCLIRKGDTTNGLIRKGDTTNCLIRKGDSDEKFVLDPPLTRFPDSVKLKLMQYEDDRSARISHSSSICLLDFAEKEYTLCIARVVFVSGKGKEQPCVIFDAYKSDLAQLDQKTKASFRFMVCIPAELFAFDSSALYRVD